MFHLFRTQKVHKLSSGFDVYFCSHHVAITLKPKTNQHKGGKHFLSQPPHLTTQLPLEEALLKYCYNRQKPFSFNKNCVANKVFFKYTRNKKTCCTPLLSNTLY
ncbi:hypothetical protein XENORESO_019953 [Xenotaenia resolanae]|uniref:Uncharacterized protein n=1 Tax=Xenotaenia resolanae TaxID=208358 RepID=A0ABV0WBM5_9TELE